MIVLKVKPGRASYALFHVLKARLDLMRTQIFVLTHPGNVVQVFFHVLALLAHHFIKGHELLVLKDLPRHSREE